MMMYMYAEYSLLEMGDALEEFVLFFNILFLDDNDGTHRQHMHN